MIEPDNVVETVTEFRCKDLLDLFHRDVYKRQGAGHAVGMRRALYRKSCISNRSAEGSGLRRTLSAAGKTGGPCLAEALFGSGPEEKAA